MAPRKIHRRSPQPSPPFLASFAATWTAWKGGWLLVAWKSTWIMEVQVLLTSPKSTEYRIIQVEVHLPEQWHFVRFRYSIILKPMHLTTFCDGSPNGRVAQFVHFKGCEQVHYLGGFSSNKFLCTSGCLPTSNQQVTSSLHNRTQLENNFPVWIRHLFCQCYVLFSWEKGKFLDISNRSNLDLILWNHFLLCWNWKSYYKYLCEDHAFSFTVSHLHKKVVINSTTWWSDSK